MLTNAYLYMQKAGDQQLKENSLQRILRFHGITHQCLRKLHVYGAKLMAQLAQFRQTQMVIIGVIKEIHQHSLRM